ncbi:putative lactoylglutathione lyase [Panacagrimonas perspica]|uniref:Putative lactoylglutathione lyase n=1 Tax=Panacagrimonas perspica TaxID=381431 RepID=A0A4R7PBG4_9GAMM|nr:VOC family protein [Panacagrimonas perspica]TDU31425.1 putative lactoylglutathione lyase [Panacagrimonas perspica]THD00830.1 glyoxalase [Panacagrimonas perspica]
MIAYATLGTNDLQRSAKFYDALLGALGAKRAMEFDRMIIWATAPNAPMLGVCTPFDGKPANSGNGTMVSLGASSKEQVDQLYKKALELGGTDEGAPGQRGPAFYIGYFRDLDGNKLNLFCPT